MSDRTIIFNRSYRAVLGFYLILLGTNVFAQNVKPKDCAKIVESDPSIARGPINPIRDFVVLKQSSLAAMEERLGTNKIEDLIGGAGMQLRVAVQSDDNKDFGDAEIHDAADDVFYILKGSAILTLGGKLENPRETASGEWRSKIIVGGRDIMVATGDVIVVPRGTPHRRSTKDSEFSMILIKVFAVPLPRATAQPTTMLDVKGKN